MIVFIDKTPAKTETKPETKPSRETKLLTARVAVEAKANKGGRPRKRDADPWTAEGISRAAWYRLRKDKPGLG